MKIKNLFIKITSIILMVCLTLSLSMMKANADETEYQYIPKSTGGYITYRGTSTKVEVPTVYEQKSTEFRGVWVSPFAGDISGYNQTDDAWKSTLLSVLDTVEKHNLNAIMFHIRTHNDALYNTNLALKSSYISSANFKKWDYLTWFIEECHKRGIEFHAWLNPYRISSKTTLNDILAKYEDFPANPAHNAENILMTSSGSAILDPGSPAVKEYLVDVCMEIIKKYDVDAIHFDDYFYEKGINDTATYNKYKAEYGNPSIDNFRRYQVDEFIENLSKEMKSYNTKHGRAVQLGISPSAVYRNGSYSTQYKYDANGSLTSPLYSNTAGYEHYGNPLYADTKKWIDNEWIDYITPQLYGSFESTGACYADILHWWAQVVKYKKVNLYAGLGVYKTMDGSDVGWASENNRTFEFTLLYNQKYEDVDGFCLYQYKTLLRNNNNKDLKKVFDTMLTNKAMTPQLGRYNISVDEVSNLRVVKGNSSYTIAFDKTENAYKYAIYKAKGNIDVNNPEHLVSIIGNSEINTFMDKETESGYTYGVRAISQSGQISDLVTVSTNDAITEIDFPFAKFNEITPSENITANGYYIINIKKATVYAGEDVIYKVYTSSDKLNWELSQTIDQMESESKNVRFQFNGYLKPVYHKIVIENEFGIIESDIITIDVTRFSVSNFYDYIVDAYNDFLKDLIEE